MVFWPHQTLGKLRAFAQIVPSIWNILDPLSILYSCFKAQGSHGFLGKESLTPCKVVCLPLCHHVLLATSSHVTSQLHSTQTATSSFLELCLLGSMTLPSLGFFPSLWLLLSFCWVLLLCSTSRCPRASGLRSWGPSFRWCLIQSYSFIVLVTAYCNL